MSSEGERRRDYGTDLTAANNRAWMDTAFAVVSLYAPHDRTFLAEEFRTYPGIGSPRHPNAWGALTLKAVRKGIIEHTGQWAKAKSARNHAHYYKVYRLCPLFGPTGRLEKMMNRTFAGFPAKGDFTPDKTD
jgi:hypothetical protein